jgi:large subunit ribosomal protein L29
MSGTELRELTAAELEARLSEAKEELFNLRFQLATSQLDNTARLRVVKRDIARILTVMREHEIQEWRAQQAAAGKDA